MDFANFVQNYLNQKTEGDPSFMVSEEAIAFVDLMRADDLDRRAAMTSQATNPNERGEPTHEEKTESVRQTVMSSEGLTTETETAFSGDEANTAIASEFVSGEPSETIAMQATQEHGDDAEAFTQTQEFGDSAQPAEQMTSEAIEVAQNQQQSVSESLETDALSFFQSQETPSPTPAAPVSEVALGTDTLQASSEEGEFASPVTPSESESLETFAGQGFQEPGEDARAVDLFSQPSQDATAITQERTLESEGATVTTIQNESGSTTFIQPPGMPEFNDLLRMVDQYYRPPDPPAGDDIEIPKPPGIPDLDEISSSTEVAERMVAQMSDDFINSSRRRA